MEAPTVIHVDVDAFFASVEQVLNPELRGRPVIVGGGVAGRGVVASASYEARRYGLKAGMPIFRARQLCPDGVYVAPDFEQYNRFSERVFELLATLSPSVEQASLDEARVSLRGCERIYGTWSVRPLARLPFVKEAEGVYRRRERRAISPGLRATVPERSRWPAAVGLWLRRAVRAETGLSVSVGIASNGLVAKAAASFAKPAGVVVVEVGHQEAFFAMLPLNRLPGIGRATMEKLSRWNVRTVEEARRLPMELLEDAFGPERGPALYDLLRGRAPAQDALDPHARDELPHSISRETTLWMASNDYETVESMLFYLTERLGRALRRLGLRGRTVQVKLRYQDFTTVQCSRSLGEHTDRDEEIFAAARRLLRQRWSRGRRLRLVGVGLTDLRRVGNTQRALFDDGADRSRRLDRCLDELRQRFGFDIIRRGPSIKLPQPAAAVARDE